jgi:hypothetical protein
VQETARFGCWRLNSLSKAYLLTSLKPEPLLTMGGWPNDKPYQQYWRPGLMVVTPEPIIDLLLPCAAKFKARVAAADAAKQPVPVSARGMAELLPYLAGVVWQDFLELVTDPGRPDSYANNPVHRLLLNGAQKERVRWVERVEAPWHALHDRDTQGKEEE